MKKTLKDDETRKTIEIEEISTCPICAYNISPIYIANKFFQEYKSFSVFCECPACNKPFVAYYSTVNKVQLNNGASTKYQISNLEYCAPTFPKAKTFDEKLFKLSPNFVETYNQSLAAESYKLSQIAGTGYRKALEFLIKDYCISCHQEKAENIQEMFLAQCISQYIDDEKIKSLAKVSAWLGNDETHYVRKFEDKDINDLKRFIDTAVFFILYNLNVDEANEIINSNS